jgi:hypothetical protein
MSWLDEYAAETAKGLQTGMSDVARGAVADIGNRYQEILMADATIRPADTLPVSADLTHDIAVEAGKEELDRAIDGPGQAPDMDR